MYDIYAYKLNNSDDIKLKERSLDVLDEELLFQYKIEKKINFKDLYFELINYIESINLDEPYNAYEKYELEDFIDDENEDSDNNQFGSYSDIKENEMHFNNIKTNDLEEMSDLDENLSDTEFKNALEKKMNFDTKDILLKNETIKVQDIEIKFAKIDVGCFSFFNYK